MSDASQAEAPKCLPPSAAKQLELLVRGGKRLHNIGTKYEMSVSFMRSLEICNLAIKTVERRCRRESMARFTLNGVLKRRHKTIEQIRRARKKLEDAEQMTPPSPEREDLDVMMIAFEVDELTIEALMDLCREGDREGENPKISDKCLADLHSEILQDNPDAGFGALGGSDEEEEEDEEKDEEEKEDGRDTDKKDKKEGKDDNHAEGVSGKEPHEPHVSGKEAKALKTIRKVILKLKPHLEKEKDSEQIAEETHACSLEATRETPASSQSVKMSPVLSGKALPFLRNIDPRTSCSLDMLLRNKKNNEEKKRQGEKRPVKDGSSPEHPEKVSKLGSSSSNDKEGGSAMSSAYCEMQKTSKTSEVVTQKNSESSEIITKWR